LLLRLLLLVLVGLSFCAGASCSTCFLPRALFFDLREKLEAIRDLFPQVRHSALPL
jgi:hypothetical protein